MLPGTYLEKRRLMAGYSLSSLARELLMLTGFGSGRMGGARLESDFRRLRLTLISAEQGSIPHSRERIDLIRNFVPLDPEIYFRLIEGEEVAGLCTLCACSFHDPCVLPVSPAAMLGTSVCHTTGTDVCSACEDTVARLAPQRRISAAAQLRDLSARMEALGRAGLTGADLTLPLAAEVTADNVIRLVPNPGEQ